MKTAVEIILEIEDLSQEEREKLDEYLNANKEVEFLKEDYSPEDIAMLDRIQAEAEQGINVSPVLKTTEESITYLRQFRKE